MKKPFYLTKLLLSFPMIIFAQSINVHTNDGAVYNYAISEIDSITFTVANSGTSCPGTPTVTYSGKTYNTVQIGDQCWLKENLDVGEMIQSTAGGFEQTDNGVIEKYCYNNEPDSCAIYGGLYEWTEAMQYVTTEGTQGICPSGWHIPTYSEMQTLETYVGDQAVKLIDENAKSSYTFTNETGFTALFAGNRGYNSGSFLGLGNYASFWSSTETGSYAINMYLHYYNSDVTFYNGIRNNGFSIRCLKD